ncbi:extracellular solute-binding protein [Fulvimarina sp. 2208YS6-2-32]|uniref:Extracellular solute-binding protein n=1 Tax=Fulvimarina uroteuthidis TaxID=3098149 RepID=A0ABU5I3D6_9HYPH|nr:extracellular solute-binding protein [Fulvimarina sp. 2208YS6-2-32]MDY8109865.1 extracellular solute-binding protein [Fulvimarina sp. 2208YS6-2-32]
MDEGGCGCGRCRGRRRGVDRRGRELMAPGPTALTRRRFGQLALGTAASLALPLREALANIETGVPLHGLSAFGELRYAAGFDHFDYANPDAPEGGQINFGVPSWILNQSAIAFDTLNTFVLQGNAPPRLESLYDSLMTSSLDEPDAIYGGLAETVELSADRLTFTFRLRPEARFSTGAPVTADDVVFSYETLAEKGHPSFVIALRNVEDVVAIDPQTVLITMASTQNYQDALSSLGIPIIPRAFFNGKDFARVTDEVIPGSGQYGVGRYNFNGFIEYEKRADYWARDLGFAKGLNHFQTIRIDFFRDRQPAFEAFRKGLIHFREEFTTKDWATGYNFPAVQSGDVILNEFDAEKRPKFQCWALNQRRERFADARVRQAINMCFDFEWTNANLLFGLRNHSDSPFQGSEFMAMGEPGPDELTFLEPLRGKIPDEVFGPVWVQPVTDGSGQDRTKLREAIRLFGEAGWTFTNNRMQNQSGEVFRLEFLTFGSEQERVYSKFMDTLRRIGIDASIRLVDAAQYQRRTNAFEFDMILAAFALTPTPTRESLSAFFGSDSVDRQGANNYPGMASEAVDSLIAEVGRVQSRDELVTVLKALDRVLRWRLDWLPNINADVHRVAYWDMFGFAEPKPDYGWPVESLWWFDEDKARAIGKA